jgi:AraC-like DNA-binding protein
VPVSQPLLNAEINEAMFFFCPRLAKIKRHVDEHYDEPFTLAQAAEIAALEKTYFSKIFRTKVGISFVDWLARERIKRALIMLMNHDHRIADLAFAVGFGDLRTFQRAFKKFVGVTPQECKIVVRRHAEAGAAPANFGGQRSRRRYMTQPCSALAAKRFRGCARRAVLVM